MPHRVNKPSKRSKKSTVNRKVRTFGQSRARKYNKFIKPNRS